MKKKLQLYCTYAKSDEREKRCSYMVNSQEQLDSVLDEENAEELIGRFDFSSKYTQTEYIYNDDSDWRSPSTWIYELMSYESESNQIKRQIDDLENKLAALKHEYRD